MGWEGSWGVRHGGLANWGWRFFRWAVGLVREVVVVVVVGFRSRCCMKLVWNALATACRGTEREFRCGVEMVGLVELWRLVCGSCYFRDTKQSCQHFKLGTLLVAQS